MRRLPTAAETTTLIALNVQRYAAERGRPLTEFRMSRGSMRKVAVRTRLEDSWISEVVEALSADHGWIVLNDEDEFLFMKREAVATWTKIGSKRVSDLTTRLKAGDAGAMATTTAELAVVEVEDDDEGD